MKKFLLAAAALALMGNVAFAGPNAGGTIFVHNPNLAYPGGPGYSACGQGTAPGSCEQAVTRLDGNTDAQVVWKVYAAFAPCTAPRLKALDMGLRYQQYDVVNGGPGIYILAYGACIGDLNQGAAEFPVNGWPGNGGQDAIVFQNAVTTTLAECYWFAGYNYYYGGVGGPQLFQLTAGQYGGNFADDGVPPSQDPIAGFGALGFGMNGTVICPGAGAEGACCDFSTGNCTLTCANDCTFTFLGPGSVSTRRRVRCRCRLARAATSRPATARLRLRPTASSPGSARACPATRTPARRSRPRTRPGARSSISIGSLTLLIV